MGSGPPRIAGSAGSVVTPLERAGICLGPASAILIALHGIVVTYFQFQLRVYFHKNCFAVEQNFRLSLLLYFIRSK